MSNPEGRKPIPLTEAQQKIYNVFVKALPGITNREKISTKTTKLSSPSVTELQLTS